MSLSIDILSLYPEYFRSTLYEVGLIKRAIIKGIISVRTTNVRDFSLREDGRVDGAPYGGGPGMVLSPQPLSDALKSVKRNNSYVICFSAQGELLDAKKCETLSKMEHLVLVSGHYEGVDERFIEREVDEEISIGNYVLTSGCPAALVLIDAVVRFVPGVLGNEEAAFSDSFQDGLLEGPQYTRPEEYEGMRVPEILLSGHHEKIKKWRREKGIEKMKTARADLYEKYMQKKEKRSEPD